MGCCARGAARPVRCRFERPPPMDHVIWISCALLVVVCTRQAFSFDNSTSSVFLEKCRVECSIQRDLASCGRYRIARWLHGVVSEKEFGCGPFRVIRIPSMPRLSVLPKFSQSRVFRGSVAETLNFVRDSVEDLLTKRALVYTIDNTANSRRFGTGLMVLDEDELESIEKRKEPDGDWRIFKKKKSVILPLLILLNLFKLKLLLLPIFLGVHFIKKLLVLGSLVVPSILAHLKVCKVPPPHQTYPYHTWATAAEAPVDYPTGYGQEDPGWLHRNDIQSPYPYPAYQGFRNPYG